MGDKTDVPNRKTKLTWRSKDNRNCNDKRSLPAISQRRNLPFERNDVEAAAAEHITLDVSDSPSGFRTESQLADAFQADGDRLAEDGKYPEALRKWEAALNLMPQRAVLHEQKAQVLLEIGDTWNALKAATCATELEPSWTEVFYRFNSSMFAVFFMAWLTLGRAQLNFGEPDNAISSFDMALDTKGDCKEAQDGRQIAANLVKRRKELHSLGLSAAANRFSVGDAPEEGMTLDIGTSLYMHEKA